MANVPGTFYTAETQRRGTTPVSPPSAVDDPIDPVNPSGPPVVPPVAERYASEAAMIADQLNQKSGYLYFDSTDTWWYLGTTNGDITDYEAFGGSSGATTFLALTDTPSSYSGQANKVVSVNAGATALEFTTPSAADSNAVHYNAADGKNASEKNQARVNIGATSATPQLITTDGAINDLAITSNNLVFSGASVVLSGIVAGQDGEEVTIVNISSTDLSILSQSALSSANNRFNGAVSVPRWAVIRIKYRSTNNRWLLENIGAFDSRYVRNDASDTKVGSLTMSLGSAEFLSLVGTGANTSGGLFRINSGFADSSISPQFYTFQTSTPTVRQRLRNKGDWIHNFQSIAGKEYDIQRSGSSSFTYAHSSVHGVDAWRFYDALQLGNRSAEDIQALRRDEQRLYYLVSVTTSGAINDQALTAGIFNYRFTLATTISGFANGETGRTIDIDNSTGATLTIQHENAGSVAANRVKLIGSADIVMPIDGKMTLKYCTGSRWELVSKNF